jgi:hypothetical protein
MLFKWCIIYYVDKQMSNGNMTNNSGDHSLFFLSSTFDTPSLTSYALYIMFVCLKYCSLAANMPML